MTNPIVNFDSNQSLLNPLKSETNVQAMIDASIDLISKEFDNALGYSSGDIVYFDGHFYEAIGNISSGNGNPDTYYQWEQTNRPYYTTTPTATGTTTLTGISTLLQFFTGVLTQNVDMPLASTLSLGRQWYIHNRSTGILTIRSSGGNTITTVPPSEYTIITCILTSGTTASSWAFNQNGISTNGTNLTLSSFLNESKASDIASATTTNIGAVLGNFVHITGTTTITGLGTIQAGTRRIVKFTGALTLTHNGTSLILPGSVSITTVAGDCAEFISLGSGNWICTNYSKVSVTGTGSQVNANTPILTTPSLGVASATSINKVIITAPASYSTLTIGDGKTLTVNNSIGFSSSFDGRTHTLPSTNSTVARTDNDQAFDGDHTFNDNIIIGSLASVLIGSLSNGNVPAIMAEEGEIGEDVDAGQILYFETSDSLWYITNNNDILKSGDVKLSLATVTGSANDTIKLMLIGKARFDADYSFAVGAPIYLSSAGLPSDTVPTSGVVRCIGYAETADSFIFKPDNYFEYLDDWTPTDASGASLSLTITNAKFHKVNGVLKIWADITYPATASGASAKLGGIPFVPLSTQGSFSFTRISALGIGSLEGYANVSSEIVLLNNGASVLNSDLTGKRFIFSATLFV